MSDLYSSITSQAHLGPFKSPTRKEQIVEAESERDGEVQEPVQEPANESLTLPKWNQERYELGFIALASWLLEGNTISNMCEMPKTDLAKNYGSRSERRQAVEAALDKLRNMQRKSGGRGEYADQKQIIPVSAMPTVELPDGPDEPDGPDGAKNTLVETAKSESGLTRSNYLVAQLSRFADWYINKVEAVAKRLLMPWRS